MSPLPTPPVAVRVPASTSNLGTGFDCLGLALDVYLDARLVGPAPGSAHTLVVRGSAAGSWPVASNLFLESFDRAAARFGAPGGPFAFEVDTEIPVARGLGSSGAAVAAGLRLAAQLAPTPPDEDALLGLGVTLEGHPDNVAASLRGGATWCVPADRADALHEGQDAPPLCFAVELHPDLSFALAWPDEEITTEAARAVLPRSVPFGDAVENARRAGLLLEGLRRAAPDLLRLGGEDRLHVRHRLPLIRGGEPALVAARAAGAWLATISGSGSALLAIASHDVAPVVAEAMAEALRAATGAGTARVAAVAPAVPVPEPRRR
jgi:homoserine kinase